MPLLVDTNRIPGSLTVWDSDTTVWDGGATLWDMPLLNTHLIRNLSGAVNNVALSIAAANATVAFTGTFKPKRTVTLAVTEANATVSLQAQYISPLAGRIVQFAITEADAVAAFTATRLGATDNAVLSSTWDMLGPMLGTANADDGFNASFAVNEANAVVALTAHTTGATTRNVLLEVSEADAVAAFAGTFVGRYTARLDIHAADAVAAFTGTVRNPTVHVTLGVTEADAVAAFTGHFSLFGVFDAVLNVNAADAVAEFITDNDTPAFNAQLAVTEADAVVRLFTSQKISTGSWPGFSDKIGLRVAGGRRGLLVDSGKPENPI